jgi:hypothetical protein
MKRLFQRAASSSSVRSKDETSTIDTGSTSALSPPNDKKTSSPEKKSILRVFHSSRSQNTRSSASSPRPTHAPPQDSDAKIHIRVVEYVTSPSENEQQQALRDIHSVMEELRNSDRSRTADQAPSSGSRYVEEHSMTYSKCYNN